VSPYPFFGWDKNVTTSAQTLYQIMDTHPDAYLYPQTRIGGGASRSEDSVDATHPEIGFEEETLNLLKKHASNAGASVK
jgi:hypothetical protein